MPELKPHQQRVVQELAELKTKAEKLALFLGSKNYMALSPEEQDLLDSQLEIMTDYARILDKRIELFKSA